MNPLSAKHVGRASFDKCESLVVCTENLNPEVVVMESAEDGERF